MEPVIWTATVFVSEPPQVFVAARVYLTVSSTGPLVVWVGFMVTDLFPLVGTEPKGSRDAASALEVDQVTVESFTSSVLSPIWRYRTSTGDAARDAWTTVLTSTVALDLVTPPGPVAVKS